MADSKLPALPALTEPAADDVMYVVDTSDTTDDPSGSSKKIALHHVGCKVLINEIELTTAGEFDFDNIPQTYKRLVIEGYLRGDESSNDARVHCYLNSDTSSQDADYHRQLNNGYDGGAVLSELNAPFIAYCSAANSPANYYGQVRIVIENYAGSMVKLLRGQFESPASATSLYSGLHAVRSSITDPVTRIRIRTDNHPTDQLLGKLTLYGEY